MNKYTQIVRECRFGTRELSLTTESELDAAEVELGYPLPEDYREFLRDFGGCSLYASYPLRNGPDCYECGYVGLMFGLNCGPYDLVRFHRDNLDNMVIVPELLQLTRDELGSVCLFLDGPHKGEIYLWYAEEVRVPYDCSNLYFIANSFDEFMHMISRIKED